MDLQITESRPQDRHFQSMPIGAPHEIANRELAFGRAPLLHVAEDRRGIARSGPRVYRPNQISHFRRWRISLSRRDTSAFTKHLVDEGRTSWCGGNLSSPGSRQRRDRRVGSEGTELGPHLADDVIAYCARNAASRKGVLYLLAAGRALSGEFAE